MFSLHTYDVINRVQRFVFTAIHALLTHTYANAFEHQMNECVVTVLARSKAPTTSVKCCPLFGWALMTMTGVEKLRRFDCCFLGDDGDDHGICRRAVANLDRV